MFVEVALPVPVRTSFTYSVPAALQDRARRGVRVRVPFGRRRLVGVVLGPAARGAPRSRTLDVEAVLEGASVDERTLELIRWIADYYQAPVGESVRLALPPQALTAAFAEIGGRGRGARPREATRVRLVSGAASPALPLDKRATRLRAILDALAAHESVDGWMPIEELRAATEATAVQIRRLEAGGWIETAVGDLAPGSTGTSLVVAGPGLRASSSVPESKAPIAGPVLNPSQAHVAGRMIAAIDRGEARTFVLRGVTGSGKTEVYFTAARRALDRGRSVVFLVPEISLTPVFTRRVRERFGEQVAVLHSRLPPRERREAWERVRSGRAPLVVGPRSALFAPAGRIGLVVVDEEHDTSYKQEETPRYHARDIALVRAKLERAVAVLGSATPSVESWHLATTGRFEPLELTGRISDRPLPAVEIVDMREELRRRKVPVLFSQALVDALEQARAKGEQAVILLNRRGYAAFAQCRACGEPVGCPRCSVSLVYHRSDETLRCHYCDHRSPRPETCPSCHSPHLVFVGEGTERIERHMERLFPGARVARLDKDTARGQGGHERILSEFESGDFDFLIGTQMVAKGHDYPGVTVVGVLEADAILGFPDFRAAERTFQLLTQVAGRAGRGAKLGRVIVQAYRCGHYAITTAARHDHQGFFEREIVYRRTLGYPPFTYLASLTVLGKDLTAVTARARRIAGTLTTSGEGRVQVLGPALAPLARLRGVFRVQILVKAVARGRLGDALRRTLDALAKTKGGTKDVVVDVDPYQLL